MAKWLISRDGKEHGPFEESQIRQLASDGKVLPNDLIRSSDGSKQRRAREIKGLFDSAASLPTHKSSSPSRRIPWLKLGMAIFLCVMTARLLEVARTRRGISPPRKTLHENEPTLIRGTSESTETLTREFLPSKVGGTWIYRSILYTTSGERDAEWAETVREVSPGELTLESVKVYRFKGDTDREEYQISESATSVQQSGYKSSTSVGWEPLVLIGARVGDSWKRKEWTYTLESLEVQGGKKTATIVARWTSEFRGAPSAGKSIVVLQEGVGVTKRETYVSLDNKPFGPPMSSLELVSFR